MSAFSTRGEFLRPRMFFYIQQYEEGKQAEREKKRKPAVLMRMFFVHLKLPKGEKKEKKRNFLSMFFFNVKDETEAERKGAADVLTSSFIRFNKALS